MKVIVCVDDDYGMMFNNRRQSRDVRVIRHIQSIVGNNKIWMNSYSKQLFEDSANMFVDENFLDKAKEDEYCFVENVDIFPYKSKINEIILYFWNRKYPSDKKFTIDFNKYKLVHKEDFEGNSHEKITQRIYR